VCINILSNVRSNAELQSRGPREAADDDVPDAADAVDESVIREEVFRASYGTIQVMPLSWGDDVPACLRVTQSTTPSLLTTNAFFGSFLHSFLSFPPTSSSPATACSKSR
jgi:hypothetical protein